MATVSLIVVISSVLFSSLFVPHLTLLYEVPMVFSVYRVKLCSCFACLVYNPWKLVGVSSVPVQEQEGVGMEAAVGTNLKVG